jgi:hypothetical protein
MEEDYADVYYVDTRNAVRDHRPGVRPAPWLPGRRPVATQTVYVPPGRPVAYPQAQVFQQQPQVVYSAPPSATAMLLGKLTPGQIVDMVAQIFAALQSLPGAPVATRDASTDIANLILYQGALAQHAKRDERLRTLGSLVARLVG